MKAEVQFSDLINSLRSNLILVKNVNACQWRISSSNHSRALLNAKKQRSCRQHLSASIPSSSSSATNPLLLTKTFCEQVSNLTAATAVGDQSSSSPPSSLPSASIALGSPTTLEVKDELKWKNNIDRELSIEPRMFIISLRRNLTIPVFIMHILNTIIIIRRCHVSWKNRRAIQVSAMERKRRITMIWTNRSAKIPRSSIWANRWAKKKC